MKIYLLDATNFSSYNKIYSTNQRRKKTFSLKRRNKTLFADNYLENSVS